MSLNKSGAAALAAEIMKSILGNSSVQFNGPSGSGLSAADAAKEDSEYLTSMFTALTAGIHNAANNKDE